MRYVVLRPGWLRFVSRCGLLFLLSAVTGCHPGWGTVSGQVLYGGAPLPGGRLTFRPADPTKSPVSVELDAQGNYQAVLPVGEVQVCLDNLYLVPRAPAGEDLPADLPLSPELREKLGGATGDHPSAQSGANHPRKSAGQFVPLPKRYYMAEYSGLKFTVKGGNQNHNIVLTNGPPTG
jgi:hypothetical protein